MQTWYHPPRPPKIVQADLLTVRAEDCVCQKYKITRAVRFVRLYL